MVDYTLVFVLQTLNTVQAQLNLILFRFFLRFH